MVVGVMLLGTSCGDAVEPEVGPNTLRLELGGNREPLQSVLQTALRTSAARGETNRIVPLPRPVVQPRPKPPQFAELREGETLGQLSQRTLGTWTRWKEIADLNAITDPNTVSAGTRLQVPGD